MSTSPDYPTQVVAVTEDATVADAAKLMRSNNVGIVSQ